MGACETHSDDHARRGNQPATSARRRLFLAPDHRPPLAGLKLVRPRPRLPARRCGRSSLTPARRDGTNRQRRGKATTKVHPPPRRPSEQVTGSTQYALLTTGALMGAVTGGLERFRECSADTPTAGWGEATHISTRIPAAGSRISRSGTGGLGIGQIMARNAAHPVTQETWNSRD